MKFLRSILMLFAAAAVSACASGPNYSEVASAQAPVASDKGRVFFYRTQVIGAAVQPTIFVNGTGTGTCQPGGVYYVDLDPGKHTANVETEVERKLEFVLEAGEEKYVRCYISIGILVGRGNLELVGASTAKGEIADLSFTGGIS